MCDVSVRTLHFYEEQGLIRPTRVDSATGYRYYSTDLLPRMNRILALRDLNLSVEEIRTVLTADPELSAPRLRELLARKQREISERVREEQSRLRRVEARLRLIEQEGNMPEYEVVIKPIDELRVAGIRQFIPTPDLLGERLKKGFDDVCAHLARNKAAGNGAPLEIWYDPEFTGHNMDVETAVPLAPGTAIEETEQIQVHTLPAVKQMACVVHHGAYEALGQVHAAIHAYLAANGLRIAGPNRCLYYDHHRNGDPNDNIAEVQYPVEP